MNARREGLGFGPRQQNMCKTHTKGKKRGYEKEKKNMPTFSDF
jgi:hypothetical protein